MADTYFSPCFLYENGTLFCEKISIPSLKDHLGAARNQDKPPTPFFVYSKAQIQSNIQEYKKALEDRQIQYRLNYAVKANMNPHLLQIMRENGCSVTLVSGMELQLALKVGFQSDCMILNGNGKQDWEIKMAVDAGCLLNIDSMFNCQQMIRICKSLNKTARVLIRINPDIDVLVHRYVDTGTGDCKFGIHTTTLAKMTELLKDQVCLEVVGLHCHLGSTITDISVFRRSAEVLLSLMDSLRAEGFISLKYLNLGGGLGIPYTKHQHRTQKDSVQGQSEAAMQEKNIVDGDRKTTTQNPSPSDIVAAINDVISGRDVVLVLEPGRSLIGNSGILVTSTIGIKSSGQSHFIVVDCGMTEVIRPSLYSAYHHIDLAESSTADNREKQEFQVVGPVCESADFLGKGRFLCTPHEGCLLAVFDTGAYCNSMSSNYNMRPRVAEVLVDGAEWKLIRRPDNFENILSPYLEPDDIMNLKKY